MSNDTLPTEVLQMIFRQITWSDQKKISLVCRRWASAVEPILLARTCLKVYDLSKYGSSYYAQHIDKHLLINPSRSYTCLSFEWGRFEKDCRTLQEILDICLVKFPVKILYLKAHPGKALADLFWNLEKWQQTLTVFHFELCSSMTAEPAMRSTVILPKLKQLTWIIEPQYNTRDLWSSENSIYYFDAAFYVPELERLKFSELKYWFCYVSNQLSQAEANDCCLFLPSLHLKSCLKLQHIEIAQIGRLDPEVVRHSEAFLQNLKSLKFLNCRGHVVQMLCEKCSNLEELIIDEPDESEKYGWPFMPFQISKVLSLCLKKLTLKNFKRSFENGAVAVFSQLHSIHLINMGDAFSRSNITLIAPELTTLEISLSEYNRLQIVHKDQIRTVRLME